MLPFTYDGLVLEAGEEIRPLDSLFEKAIRYYDSLLDVDAQSKPVMEQDFLDRFAALLESLRFAVPPNLREYLIKLSYGYFMRRNLPDE